MVKPSNDAANAIMHLQMQRVTFGYRQEPLLYDVSLSIKAGEMVGLLGPNGSGKTTLLRLLSGVLRPQQGEVLLAGRSLQHWGRRGVAQRIAVMPQELHMPFAFTVEHMVNLGRIPFIGSFAVRTARDKMIVQDAMHIASVTALAHRVFNELSGGERQRVLIAMALAQEPLVLLLDEPTAHLDIKYQIETLVLLQRLNRERGVTVVAAMHDLNLAARYFPRLIVFQRGVVADAGPAEVLEPGLLGRVYGVNVQVGILRGAEHLSVLPPGSSDEHRERVHALVHVIAGGGSGELMMRALADAHIPFSAGALNIGDSDYTLALRLAQDVIVEQPYAPIGPETVQQVQARLAQVALLILCPTPIGPGNLVLLQESLVAAQRGLPTILLAATDMNATCAVDRSTETDDGELQPTGMAARDYTNGQALKLVGQLLQAGAILVSSVGEAVEVVNRHVVQQDAVEG